ncbi:MAG: type II secretion system F family protein, partial [Ilumatobacteraceae bacterium]
MNPLQIGAAVGVLLAAGVWCTVQSFQRAPRSLAAARHRMAGTGRAVAPSRGRRANWVEAAAAGAPGRWAASHFGERLATIGLTPVDVVTRVLSAAGVMGFIVLAGVVSLMAMGLLPVSVFWLGVVVSCAALAGWVTVHDLSAKIERRQREMRQAANDFIQLVAIGLTTDQSVEEALRFALAVGASDAFDALRLELQTAPQRGVPIWEALEEFGERSGVRELSEFAASVERQGLQGVSISDTVASLAAAMRAKTLDQLERDADKANANLSGPTIGFVVTTIVFLAYPLAQ